MLFLKHRILSLRAKRIARKDTLPRYTVDFEKAMQIGILYQGKPPFFAEEALKMKRMFEAEGKKVTVLAFYQTPPEELPDGVQVFTPKDITILGKINSEIVDNFIRTNFDYLYCISPAKASIFDVILAKSLAKCRVGCDDRKKRFLYEMMFRLKPNDDGKTLIDEMMRFTRALVGA